MRDKEENDKGRSRKETKTRIDEFLNNEKEEG